MRQSADPGLLLATLGGLLATLGGLLAIVAWDASGLDIWLAQLVGNTHGFPLRNDFWLTTVLHDGGRALGWACWLALVAVALWPPPFLRMLAPRERWRLALGVLVAVAAIDVLKLASHTSCPWSLVQFGGAATYVSHWNWHDTDGGPGHCFPAAHAAAGFAFVTGWFVWRRSAPRIALPWLLGALIVGFVFGIAQQLRGAHFMSHTLWSAWICWTVGYGIDVLCRVELRPGRLRREP